jgi:putative salt-induced outer membrane protein YdiY
MNMKLMKEIVLGLVVALPVVGFSDAVTNVTWKSSLGLGATYKSGNTEKSLFTGTLKGDRYAPKSDWINSLYGEYGKTEGNQTEGQVRGQSDYRYKFGTENFYGGVFGEAYQDTIKEIRVRLKLGPNVGYYFINKADMKLDTSVGVNYVYERTSGGERDYGEWRLAGNYLWDITELSSFYLNVEYSANLEDANDGNGLLVTGVKSRLKDNLSMFAELRDEYDNIPDSATTEYNDVTIVAGLTYDF